MSRSAVHRRTGARPSDARRSGSPRRPTVRRAAALITAGALLAGAAPSGAGAQGPPPDGDAVLHRQVEAATRLDPATAANEDLVAAITAIDQLTQTLVARGAEAERNEKDAGRRLAEIAATQAQLHVDIDRTANTLRRVAVRLYLRPDGHDSPMRLLRAHSADEAQQQRVLIESASGSSRESIARLRSARAEADELEREAASTRTRAVTDRAQREALFVEHATATQAQQRLQVEWLKRIAAIKRGTDDLDGGALGTAIAKQSPFTKAAPAPAPAGRMIKPINVPVGSGYGIRNGKPHTGVDFPAPVGTPVRAALGGRVKEISTGDAWNGGYGNWVVLTHPNGTETHYAHLSAVSVSTGQSVDQGDVVGRSGNTGSSQGPHLHFEVLAGGRFQNPMNYL